MLTRIEQSLVDAVVHDDVAMEPCALAEATLWRNRAVQLVCMLQALRAEAEAYADILAGCHAFGYRYVSEDGKWVGRYQDADE